jgi:hypothetical protein
VYAVILKLDCVCRCLTCVIKANQVIQVQYICTKSLRVAEIFHVVMFQGLYKDWELNLTQ